MDINKLFDDFCSELKKRNGFLSEDNIRFYWFASMLKQDSALNHYSLEEPYGKAMKGKELDLMYIAPTERLCIEIKFHRNGESESTYAHTMAAGEIFDDLQRLPHWDIKTASDRITRYLFLYVTDEEMNNYLSLKADSGFNKCYRKTLCTFYTSKIGKIPVCEFTSKERNGDTPKTFIESACESYNKDEREYLLFDNLALLHKADNIKVNSRSVKGNCNIRLYEVFLKQ